MNYYKHEVNKRHARRVVNEQERFIANTANNGLFLGLALFGPATVLTIFCWAPMHLIYWGAFDNFWKAFYVTIPWSIFVFVGSSRYFGKVKQDAHDAIKETLGDSYVKPTKADEAAAYKQMWKSNRDDINKHYDQRNRWA